MYNSKMFKVKKIFVSVVSMFVFNAILLSVQAKENFKMDCEPNHWGNSLIRHYLNDKDNGYASFFRNDEYKMIKENTVQTSAWGLGIGELTYDVYLYETTDKFYLPSGNCHFYRNEVISWGKEDISEGLTQDRVFQKYPEYLIPSKYFTDDSWLRSPSSSAFNALCSNKGGTVYMYSVDYPSRVAPVFKVDLSQVYFASTASAQDLAKNNVGTVCSIPTDDALSHKYGMYLKLKDESVGDFNIKSVKHSEDGVFEIEYTGAAAGKDLVICTENENTAYCASQKILSEEGTVKIDCQNWGLNDLTDLKLKFWLESVPEENSLAYVSDVFICNGSDLENIEKLSLEAPGYYTKNEKVFSLKKDLSCSWGEVTDIDYGTYSGGTNQKIFFGRQDDVPMSFWIAGREDPDENLDDQGDVVCLYADSCQGVCKFNLDTEKKLGFDRVTLVLKEGINVLFTGEEIQFSKDDIFLANENLENVRWRYRTHDEVEWTCSMPKETGEYEIQAFIPETDEHETIYSVPVNFKIIKIEEPDELQL